MEYSLFFRSWPWMGLGAAIVLLILAFGTNVLRSNTDKSRWKDPTWIAWLGSIAYMLHNFEEYGVAFDGATMSFANMMNEMGLSSVTEAAYLGCNIPFVWIAGPLLAILSRKYPALCGAMPVFTLINGLSHCVQIPNVGYNPGLVTSIVIFIPLGIYTMVTFFGKREGKFTLGTLGLIFSVAFLYMVCIMGAIGLSFIGVLAGSLVQGIFITLGTALVFGLFFLVGKRAKVNGAEQPC